MLSTLLLSEYALSLHKMQGLFQMFSDCLLCISLAHSYQFTRAQCRYFSFHRAFSNLLPRWAYASFDSAFAIPEIFVYQQIPQYCEAYSSHNEFAAGVDHDKTEFWWRCRGRRERMGEDCQTQLLVHDPSPNQNSNGSVLGLEDSLRKVEISNIKFMNITGPVWQLSGFWCWEPFEERNCLPQIPHHTEWYEFLSV